MTYTTALRERFTDGALDTASGPKIIVLAYARLDRDLGGAIEALAAHDVSRSHELLCHAQELVHELLCMLDVDVWDGAAPLAAIYQYVTELLVRANVTKQVAEALEARHLLAELGDAFKQAAVQLAITSSPRSQGATDQIEQRRLSVRA